MKQTRVTFMLLNDYLKQTFGCKVYKIALDGGFTCPNRDGRIELGLQTTKPETAMYVRRGYDLSVYDDAVKSLRSRNIEVVTHVILGLPGEAESDMLNTVEYVCKSGATGIKLQLLHVLEGTDLAEDYRAGKFNVLTEDEYILILQKCMELIPQNIVIHRLTGDGDKRILIAPLWSGNKKHVWNRIQREVLADADAK